RDVDRLGAAGDEFCDFGRDAASLSVVVLIFGEPDGGPALTLGDEFHSARPPVATGTGEDLVREVDHLRGGPVVAVQGDDLRAGVGAGEVGEVARGGAGEGVDRLGNVTD